MLVEVEMTVILYMKGVLKLVAHFTNLLLEISDRLLINILGISIIKEEIRQCPVKALQKAIQLICGHREWELIP